MYDAVEKKKRNENENNNYNIYENGDSSPITVTYLAVIVSLIRRHGTEADLKKPDAIIVFVNLAGRYRLERVWVRYYEILGRPRVHTDLCHAYIITSDRRAYYYNNTILIRMRKEALVLLLFPEHEIRVL